MGCGFPRTGSRTQFFDPHGVPSGGDWALQRDAALFFEGTTGMSMRECTVTRVDGNAVMLSGFNRRAVIADNEFTWIGDSVIASWGHTKEVEGVEGNDGTNGEQPRGTQIVRNLVHENGFFSKQASPYFQAKAAQTLLADNIFFNGPRAGVNINDGFAGNNLMEGNLVLNMAHSGAGNPPHNAGQYPVPPTEVTSSPLHTGA